MNFLSPSSLVLAGILPVIVLFYLLKRKRVSYEVSSTLLWERFLAETQANAPFQKLRRHILLLLQLLVALLIILALARPYRESLIQHGGLSIVVLDASASMQASDVTPNRFEAARSLVQDMIDSMRSGDRMVLIQAGGRTEVLHSPSEDGVLLSRALERAKVTDAPGHLDEALDLAIGLARGQGEAHIHLISDGANIDLSEFENRSLSLHFHSVGQQAENVGIVALDLKQHPEDPSRRALLAGLSNFGSQVASVTAVVELDGVEVARDTLEVGPGATESVVHETSHQGDGIFRVRLEHSGPDWLSVDDQASLAARPLARIPVTLIGQDRSFLEKALLAIPEVDLVKLEGMDEIPQTGGVMVVATEDMPAGWPDQGNVLAFRALPTDWRVGLEERSFPVILDWVSTHPVFRFVSLENVRIQNALKATKPQGAEVLIESGDFPLAWALDRPERKALWVAFDPVESTWPLRVSFPMFMANAVRWLHPGSSTGQDGALAAGTPFEMRLEQVPLQVRALDPQGQEIRVDWKPGSTRLKVSETLIAGDYRVEADGLPFPFCVNLLDAGESRIQPSSSISLGDYQQVESMAGWSGQEEYWRWLALLALVFLMAEWWYFHRRTV